MPEPPIDPPSETAQERHRAKCFEEMHNSLVELASWIDKVDLIHEGESGFAWAMGGVVAAAEELATRWGKGP